VTTLEKEPTSKHLNLIKQSLWGQQLYFISNLVTCFLIGEFMQVYPKKRLMS